MKKKLLVLGLLILMMNSVIFNDANAQNMKFTDGIAFKVGGGLTTFYGELGGQGLATFKNVKAGFSASAIKMFNPSFGLQIQYTGGNLYSVRTDLFQYFNGFVNEIGLSARLHLLPLLAPSLDAKFNPYLRAGIASTSFRTARRDIATNTIYLPAYGFQNDGLTKVASANALAIPLAIGLSVDLTENVAVELEQSLSITNTDVLDALPGTAKINDMFGLTQIGLKYTINPIKRSLQPRTGSQSNSSRFGRTTKSNKTPRNNNTLIDYPETNVYVETIIPEKPISGKVFEVQSRINKSSYEGPAILTHVYPNGFTAIESALGSAQFSFVNQTVRVVWDQMPKDSIIVYSYLVRPSENTRGSYTVNGNLEYKQNDGPQVIHFANYIDVSNRIETGMDSRILSLLDDQDDNKTKDVKEDQKKENDLDIEELLRIYGGNASQTETNKTATDAGADPGDIAQHQVKSGAEFRIQIGAFSNRQQGQAIVRRYSLPETVYEEIHNGLYKYTLGSFSTYKQASDYRDEFIRRSQIWSAFIVGYKDGVRMSKITEVFK